KVVAAAEQVRDALYDTLPFRIAYDPSDAAATRLLQALAVWGAVRHASETYGQPAQQLSTELAEQRPLAAPAGANPVRRLLQPGARGVPARAPRAGGSGRGRPDPGPASERRIERAAAGRPGRAGGHGTDAGHGVAGLRASVRRLLRAARPGRPAGRRGRGRGL